MTDVPPHATRQAKTAADPIVSVRWSGAKDAVRIIDQRALPERLVELEVSSLDDVCACINTLAVRGAPLIGVFAAMGLAALMRRQADLPRAAFDERLEAAAAAIRATRPTAANLGSALERMLACARAAAGEPLGVAQALWRTAESIRVEDAAMCQRIGEHAQGLIPYAARILTHCNTGVLATAGSGTALAGVYRAHAAGRRPSVYACETRPLLQGSRLTAWELQRCGIPVTLIADSMAAALMREGSIDLVLVGADRIAANGDVANKIGTYALAVLARHHRVPFYVAAPATTVDASTPSGSAIPIEARGAAELRSLAGIATAPADVEVYNPAFDITPETLVTAVITDAGVQRPPYDFSLPVR